VWKIPETAVLLEQRNEVDADDWLFEEEGIVGMSSNIPVMGLGPYLDIPSIREVYPRNALPACFSFTTTFPLER
jgi:hypothetical protein